MGALVMSAAHVTGTTVYPAAVIALLWGGGWAGGGERSWIPDSGTITPDAPTASNTSTVYYNELATLLLNTGGLGGGGAV